MAKQGWSIVSSDATAGRISAKTGMNLLTWGDDITVLVRQTAPNVVKVDVGSQTNMQLIPSGLSESNIENFYSTLDKLAHRIN